MSYRSALIAVVSMLTLACARPAEAPAPPEPVADAPEPEPEPAPQAEETDLLTELGGDQAEPDTPTSSRPAPIEVEVDAVMTDKTPGATMIMVGADARFTLNMKIESVEPETPLLPPGHYDVLIHSPSRTFRGPVPGKGTRIQFKLSIIPDNPDDPHDETFFAEFWIE